MRTIVLITLTFISHLAVAQERLPGVFTYQGRAYQADGTTPLGGNATFLIQIRSSNGNCLLYQESHTAVDLTASAGLFALNIGDGSAKSGLSLTSVFSNSNQPKATLSGTCGGTYTPANQEARVLRITVNTGTPVQLDDQYIYSVPKALVADSLNGYTYNQFVQHLTTTQRDALTAMVNGTTIYNITTGRFNRYNGATWTEAFGATSVGTGSSIYKGKMSGNDWLELKSIIGSNGIIATSNTNDVTLTIDPTYTQRRITGTCSAGNFITGVNQDGTVVCAADATGGGGGAVAGDGTTISGDGTSGSEFAVIPAGIDIATLGGELAFTQLPTGCNDNNILKMNGSNWNCEPDGGAGGGGLTTVATDNTTIDGDGDTTPLFLMDGAVTTVKIGDDQVTAAKIADGAIDVAAKLAATLCTDGQILKKVAGAWACAADTDTGLINVYADTTTIEGDGSLVTPFKIVDGGVNTTQLANDAVTAAKLADASIDAAAKLATGLCAANQVLKKRTDNAAWECANDATGTALPAMTDAQIIVSNGTTPAAVAMSGDVAISNTGATTIQNNAVETAMINAGAVTFAKIAVDVSCAPNYVLTVNGTGDAWVCAPLPLMGAVNIVEDADGDTTIQVEAAADEDHIRFRTAGTERVTIDEAGNVGIGTDDPLSQLHVMGSSGADVIGVIESVSGQNSSLKLGSVANNTFSQFVYDTNGALHIETRSPSGAAGPIIFSQEFDSEGAVLMERMRIDSNGQVGIGIDDPQYELDVSGSIRSNSGFIVNGNEPTPYTSWWGAATLPAGLSKGLQVHNYSDLDGNGAGIHLSVTNSDTRKQNAYIGAVSTAGGASYSPHIVFGSQSAANNYSEKMRITSSGNVGIGTDDPNQKLHVVGNIRMVDGNEQAGRVLTSDANGVGTWQDAAAGGLAAVATDNATIDGDGDGTPLFLMDNAVTTVKINDGAVTTAKIGDDQVTAAKIADGAIDAVAKFGTGLCSDTQIFKKVAGAWACAADSDTTVNQAVEVDGVTIQGDGLLLATALKVADNGIDTLQLANEAVTAAKIEDGAVTTAKILNGTILFEDIATNGCTADQIIKRASDNSGWVCAAPASAGTTISGGTDNMVPIFNATGDNIENGSIEVEDAAVGIVDFTGTNPQLKFANSLFLHKPGTGNIFMGTTSGNNTLTGTNNIGLGSSTLNSVTSGNYNIAVGPSVLSAVTTGTSNIGLGIQSLMNATTAGSNVAIGYVAMTSVTTGGNNVGVGSSAMRHATTAGNSVAVGSSALLGNSTDKVTGTHNTAVGNSSMYSATTAHTNSALGSSSLFSITTGAQNTSIGNNSSRYLTSGINNVAVGMGALQGDGITANTGSNNTAVGNRVLGNVTSGTNNVAVGGDSMYSTSSGNNNTALGFNAGRYASSTSANSVFLGYGAGPASTAAADSKLYISNVAGTPLIYGDFSGSATADSKKVGINKIAATYALEVNGSVDAVAYYYTSDARLKERVEALDPALQKILQLKPVTFDWIETGKHEVGFIAQEVETVYPDLVATNKEGFKAVKYGNLVAPLVSATQELYGICKMSEKQLASLEARVEKHDRRIASLETENEKLKKQIEFQNKENQAIKSYLCSKDPQAPICR